MHQALYKALRKFGSLFISSQKLEKQNYYPHFIFFYPHFIEVETEAKKSEQANVIQCKHCRQDLKQSSNVKIYAFFPLN